MSWEDSRTPGPRTRIIHGRQIVFDSEGFFDDPDDWTEDTARFLAVETGLDPLGDDHLNVLRFLRDYYYCNGRAPLNNVLRNGINMRISRIEALFPGGIKFGARRLAGLPNPKSCM
ncbi:TusE/DsrC/DsvC family sulfur relay protein [Desulfotignum balticum]|uniref:TusE/DsrC/DsvC family sulfur relay protein n=1 Tax=Desulfotignum balticum TaxID=115781 RepID=UPI0003FE3349|nr:TusE/DsrC/DsvC family sulfur relay protein [Desulfotignum balticum]